MRVLIVGTGVIGSIYGWALAEAGHQVVHLVRSERVAALAAGVPLDLWDTRPGGTRPLRTTYHLTSLASPRGADDFDLVIVPTKPWQLIPALQELGPETGAADYLITTGNWHGTASIEAALGPGRYLLGDPIGGGGFANGTLVGSLSRRFVIGEVDGQPTVRLSRAIAMFDDAGIAAEVPADIQHWHWLQYAVNAGLLGALASAGGFDHVAHSGRLIDRGLFAAREGLNVCLERGVRLELFPAPRTYYDVSWVHRRLMALGLRYQLRFNQAVKRNTAHALSSPREVSTFYHDVLATGRELGVPMPYFGSFEHDVDAFVTQRTSALQAAAGA